MIVLHATAGGSLADALEALRERGFGYHYLIEKNGACWKAVPSGAITSHAGESFGPEGPGVNAYSLGISLVNLNDGADPYPEAQLESLIALLSRLRGLYPGLEQLTTHAAIAPERKNDPLGLDAESIATRAGLLFWPGTSGESPGL